MAYYLQGNVSREFIFNTNVGEQLHPDTINNSLLEMTSLTLPTPTVNSTNNSIMQPRGVSRFRFQMTEDVYAREVGLKWVQLPLIMETLPRDLITYVHLRIYSINCGNNGAAPRFCQTDFFYDLTHKQTLGSNPLPNFAAYAEASTINQTTSVAPYFSPTFLCNVLNNFMRYYLANYSYYSMNGQEFDVALINNYEFFSFNNDLLSYTFNWPQNFFGTNYNPLWASVTGVALGFGFINAGTNNINTWALTQLNVGGNVKNYYDPPAPMTFSAPTASQLRSATRSASMVLGLPNRVPSLIDVATFTINNPEESFISASFLYYAVDFITNFSINVAQNPNPPTVTPLQAPITSVLSMYLNGGAPVYYNLHSNIMQSSKIKPMISAYQLDNTLVFPFDPQQNPQGSERSSTILATIPLRIDSVTQYGSFYLWRNDQSKDHLLEFVPSRIRDIEFWFTYPDGSDVYFDNQYPVISLNILDNNSGV